LIRRVIRRNPEAFVVVADLPGADEKSVEATVQKRVLTIEGWTQIEKPQGGEELGREFGAGRFRRDFTLPDAVDPERIQARVKHGVLTVTIPKKEEVKARKIQVTG
ncbi:MAG TPA: Hsp20/alpha crystallin family protein, partial [Kiritimatiellia bacterium]|nr:Hsp20/alpha crystallin family protein [Kiritimatiellia bacterium]